MKRNKRRQLSLILFAASAVTMLYPTTADCWNRLRYSYLAGQYHEECSQYSEDRTAAFINMGIAYNSSLDDATFLRPDETQKQMYTKILDPDGSGLIGTIEIPGLIREIPVYHSTDESVLQNGIGHIEGSSFPVYGTTTHCLLAGHTGLKHSKLFTDLSRIRTGDTFRIHILGLVSEYVVDDIRTVLPEDTDFLCLEDNREYCSLITCTPYGINSHRLIVRGVRMK